jgi:hypothetical protein
MKKLILMLGLFLSFAGASFSQSLVVNPQPTCSTPQIGAYSIYSIAAGGSINPIPLGFNLCGTYTKLTVTMSTPVPAGETDNVIFGIQDLTSGAYLDCSIAIGDTTCTATSSASFTAGDNIVFIIYIPGSGHTGYVVQNLAWRLS